MKSPKQIESERTKRRANIRRGMKIALYEVQQLLAEQGMGLTVPRFFIPYTVAIAEGGRRDATAEDRATSLQWQLIRDIGNRLEQIERSLGGSCRVFIIRGW